jgi:nucleoside-diphosphate-sugar epimerase
MPKILIVGASGVVGAAALDQFLARDDFDVVAVSRRTPEIFSDREYQHLPVDLRDADATAEAFSGLTGVTHVIYTALFEKPGLVAGWRDTDQMQTNLSMLRNVLEPLQRSNTLEHVSLLQGAKAYGTHIHSIPVPAKEAAPRDPHENFYWLQEDYVREQSAERGFAWTVLRPQLIVGGAVGVAMNLAPVIGAYAAICAEIGEPFSYPGGPSYVWETVDSRICASALEWAAEAETARNQIFNVTNGDVFEWRHLWPTLAQTLGVEAGPDHYRSTVEFIEAHKGTWARIAERDGLRIADLSQLVGESHYYADRCFAYGQEKPYDPRFLSTIKIRQAGYSDFRDTTDTFTFWLQALTDRRYLPKLG